LVEGKYSHLSQRETWHNTILGPNFYYIVYVTTLLSDLLVVSLNYLLSAPFIIGIVGLCLMFSYRGWVARENQTSIHYSDTKLSPLGIFCILDLFVFFHLLCAVHLISSSYACSCLGPLKSHWSIRRLQNRSY
jgi:hypothetical protein